MFSAYEEWDFISAIYFSFITLTTIGFGDFTPTKSFKGIEKGATGQEIFMMGISVFYCSVGQLAMKVRIYLVFTSIDESMKK